MAEFPSLPLWTDAYIADTSHLSCLESGAYLHLLMAAWRSPECRLPFDENKLARMARCNMREWKRIREAVLAFWDYDEKTNSLTQKRLLREQQWCRANSQQRSRAANARWLKINETSNANASSPHMQNSAPAYAPIPIPILKKEKREKTSLSGLVAETAKAMANPTKGHSVDWEDRRNRKARWEQKIETELRLSYPGEVSEKIIAGYANGGTEAKAIYEQIDNKLKQRRGLQA